MPVPVHLAQRQSPSIDAAAAGHQHWATPGSLASEAIDQPIFSLPVGCPSERLEGSEGFHIVRVIERTEAGPVPFEQAHVEIKKRYARNEATNESPRAGLLLMPRLGC